MEGKLLSVRFAGGEDAAVLRGAVSDGRDQLHVLPYADREARARLGRADAVAVQTDAESAAAHHTRQPAQGFGGAHRELLSGGGIARRQARRAAVPAAAESEEGSRALRRVPGRPAAEGLRRLRVPERLMARRRGVLAPRGAESGAVRRRQRKALDAGACDGGLCVLPPARRGL